MGDRWRKEGGEVVVRYTATSNSSHGGRLLGRKVLCKSDRSDVLLGRLVAPPSRHSSSTLVWAMVLCSHEPAAFSLLVASLSL